MIEITASQFPYLISGLFGVIFATIWFSGRIYAETQTSIINKNTERVRGFFEALFYIFLPLLLAGVVSLAGVPNEIPLEPILVFKLAIFGLIYTELIYYDFEFYPFFGESIEKYRIFPQILEDIGSKISSYMDLTSTTHLLMYVSICFFFDIALLSNFSSNFGADQGLKVVMSAFTTLLIVVFTLIISGYKDRREPRIKVFIEGEKDSIDGKLTGRNKNSLLIKNSEEMEINADKVKRVVYEK